MITNFNIVYLLGTMLQIYAIYKFMAVFFSEENRDISHEWVMYAVYYCAITSMYLIFRTPAITIITNMVCLFLIASRYTLSYRKAILSMLYIYILLMLIDVIFSFALMPHLIGDSLMESHVSTSSVAVIIINLVNYAVVLGISRIMTIRNGKIIPGGYWVSLIFLPMMTIYIVLSLFNKYRTNRHEFVIISSLLLVANFIVFYLYDVISQYFEVQIQDASFRQLNSCYENQFEMMAKSESNIRSFRHDFNKHLAILSGMASVSNNEEISNYLKTLSDDFYYRQEVVTTGNVVVDSIINYELNGYKEAGIQLNFHCSPLPEQLRVEDTDMTIILSNLLDNAMAGVMKIQDHKVMNLEIKFDKGIFFIGLSNTYVGEVTYKQGRIQTSKEDDLIHGLGIRNVRHVVEKYNGSMRIHHDNEKFTVEVVIYVKQL